MKRAHHGKMIGAIDVAQPDVTMSGQASDVDAAGGTMPKQKNDQGRKVGSEIVMVSAVVGEGTDAHRLVQVGAWGFTVWDSAGDGEPRMRDADAGERLGFGRDTDIRPLIRRTFKGEKLKDIHVRDTVTWTQMPAPGGIRKTIVPEFWLTEAQLLKVIARSETEIADVILDDMIRVYMLARRGLLPQQAPITPEGLSLALIPILDHAIVEATAPLVVRLVEQRSEIVALQAQTIAIGAAVVRSHELAIDTNKRLREIATRDGRITPEDAAHVRGQIDLLAQMHLRLGYEKKTGSERSARSGIVGALFDRISWGGAGETLDNILAKDVPIVKNHVEYEIKTARRELRRRRQSIVVTAKKQRGLFDEKPN
jgi:hypothetical protein